LKVNLGGGAYLEPDESSRRSPYHKRIVSAVPIPNTRCGNNITLECGHRAQSYGDLALCGGVVLCTVCRDAAQ